MRIGVRTSLVTGLGLLLAVGAMSFMGGCNGARDTAYRMVGQGSNGTGFHIKQLNGNGRKYGLFIPANYTRAQNYPVIVFLHGVGEGGSDVSGPLHVGLAPFVADQYDRFQFICIFPQSGSGQWDPDSDAAKDVIAAIEEVKHNYSVDADRVFLTGLSTGGYGTWAIGSRYKSVFAGLVPMGSSASAFGEAQNLVDMPIWSFHNSGDMFAATYNDSHMVDKINQLGGHAKYTQHRNGSAGSPNGINGKSSGAASASGTPTAAKPAKVPTPAY